MCIATTTIVFISLSIQIRITNVKGIKWNSIYALLICLSIRGFLTDLKNVHCVTGTSSFCVQLVFEGIRGSSFRGDIAIDDIQLKDGSCAASSGLYTL